ncbi:MAG: glycerophosphodiester phosphodiesterase [Candidatus Hodarchaeota archaeon]
MIQDFLFIGHRGTSVSYDENTILAFKKAIEYGADCIELDVRKTKDEKLIVIHDPTLKRTTNGMGLVKELTHKEILNFRTKVNLSFIPLLSEVFNELKGKTKFMIELKEKSLIDDIVKLIIENDLLEDCIISGKYLMDLLEFKKKFPQNKMCYNITKGQGLSLTEFLELSNDKSTILKIDMISLRSSLISQEFIEKCRKNKIISLSWDFLRSENPINKIKSLITLGINGILFDNYKNIPKIKKWQSLL